MNDPETHAAYDNEQFTFGEWCEENGDDNIDKWGLDYPGPIIIF